MLQSSVPVELSQAPSPALPAPQQFRAVQSVVFRFYGRTMTGIGVLSLDRAARTFELSCMTPMGSKLFDLRYGNETPEVLFALPFFTEREGFAEAVAQDIARIYFDPVPPRIDRAFRKGDELRIQYDPQPNLTLEYVYQGIPAALTEKRVMEERALIARIEYRDFFNQEGFRCLAEAGLTSRQYRYELTVRTKEMTIIE